MVPRAGKIAPFAVALTTFLVFSGTLRNGFVLWDDDVNFLLNPHYRGLGWPQIRWMFTSSFQMGHYMPLTWLTLGLDFTLWGMNPLGYHLTSLLLHCANAAVFFFVSRRLFVLAAPAGGDRPRPSLDFAAAFSALIFALHPLRVESVAWITERRDVLSGLFYLLTILFYLKAGACAESSKGWRWLALSVASFSFALLSKISGITLPLALIVIDIYPSERLPGNPRLWFSESVRRVWLEKIPFVLVAFPAGLLGIGSQARAGGFVSLVKWSAAERVSTALFGAAFYVWKTVAPWGLSPLYALPQKINPLAGPFLLSAFAVAAITVLALAARRARPALLAAWTYYLVVLLPVSGLAQSGWQIAADRYTYIPCWGFSLLAAGALTRFWTETARRGWRNTVVLSGIILLALSYQTCRQVQVWRESETLWGRALSLQPDLVLAHANLGMVFAGQGKLDEAIRHYRLALRTKPDMAEARNGLGIALAGQGKLDEAIRQYDLALQEQPDFAEARYNLGLALAKKKYEAAQHLDEAIQQYELGLASAGRGKINEAIQHYDRAIEANPNLAEAHNNLGGILAAQGKLDEAIRHYDSALQARPDYAGAHYNLGLALARQGKTSAAVAQFRETLRISPGFAPARGVLDFLLKRLEQNR